jgi:hypothetical protein
MAGIVLSIVCSVPSAEEIRQAQRVVLANADFQTTLPGHVAPPRDELRQPQREPRWEEPRPRRAGNRPVRTERRGRPADVRGQLGGDVDGGDIGRTLAWTLLAVLGLVLLAALIRNMGGFTRNVRRKQSPADAAARPTPLALTRPLTESERLAASGDYGEAIHILLLETLSELGTRIPGSVQRSWTSREILARSALAEEARGALSLLVHTVEASLFGHADAGPEEYDRSREAFAAFVKAVRRGARAA